MELDEVVVLSRVFLVCNTQDFIFLSVESHLPLFPILVVYQGLVGVLLSLAADFPIYMAVVCEQFDCLPYTLWHVFYVG